MQEAVRHKVEDQDQKIRDLSLQLDQAFDHSNGLKYQLEQYQKANHDLQCQ